jgi:hypothetical protein
MKRFVEGKDRRQGVLLPEFLDEYVSDENPVRVIDVFVDELDLGPGGSGVRGGRARDDQKAGVSRQRAAEDLRLWLVCAENLKSNVMMVKSAKDWERADCSSGLDRARFRSVLV